MIRIKIGSEKLLWEKIDWLKKKVFLIASFFLHFNWIDTWSLPALKKKMVFYSQIGPIWFRSTNTCLMKGQIVVCPVTLRRKEIQE